MKLKVPEVDSIKLCIKVMEDRIFYLKDKNKSNLFSMYSEEYVQRHEEALDHLRKFLNHS